VRRATSSTSNSLWISVPCPGSSMLACTRTALHSGTTSSSWSTIVICTTGQRVWLDSLPTLSMSTSTSCGTERTRRLRPFASKAGSRPCQQHLQKLPTMDMESPVPLQLHLRLLSLIRQRPLLQPHLSPKKHSQSLYHQRPQQHCLLLRQPHPYVSS
jgi:hypothetical protein